MARIGNIDKFAYLYSSLKMPLRSITDELQNKAINELNEYPTRIEENLQHFREWLQKQPHLQIKVEDETFLSFLRGCKWSLQRAKEKLDYFYTMRTLIPEFFKNRDPFSSDIQEMLQRGVCYALPKPDGTDGPRIYVMDFSNVVPETMPLISVAKLYFMVWDILLNEDDNFLVSGVKIVTDFSHMPVSYILQFTPATVKKFLLCIQHAYPVRIKKMIGINAPVGVEVMFNNLCKPLLSKKLAERVVIYSSNKTEELSNHIAKSLLPEKYGGQNGSCSDLTETWKAKVENYREWFLEDNKNICDERLRPGKPKSYNEEFNMEGTFRTLEID